MCTRSKNMWVCWKLAPVNKYSLILPTLNITGWLFESANLQCLLTNTLYIATFFASPSPVVCGMEWVVLASVVPGCWGAVGEFGHVLKVRSAVVVIIALGTAMQLLPNPVGGTYVLYLFWEVIQKQQISKANMFNTNFCYWLFRSGLTMSLRLWMNSQFTWPNKAMTSSKVRATFSSDNFKVEISLLINWSASSISGIVAFWITFRSLWSSPVSTPRAWSYFRDFRVDFSPCYIYTVPRSVAVWKFFFQLIVRRKKTEVKT